MLSKYSQDPVQSKSVGINLKKAAAFIRLMRPKHWTKNLFVFIPAFFAGEITLLFADPSLIFTFFSFCLAASTIYVLNDLLDVEKDRQHPTKQHRPIASGLISKGEATVFGLFLLAAAVAPLFFVGGNGHWYVLAYVGLNILYSFYLKHIPIIDITIISVGFLLRVLAGGAVAGVFVSQWLVLMTFLLAMCLALGKRRDGLIILEVKSGENKIRPSLNGYNLEFINTALGFMAVLTVVCYIMYSISEDVVERLGSEYIYYTSLFVILGLLRFLQVAIVEKKSGSPTELLLKDRFIQLTLAGWILTFTVILYFK